MQDFGMQDFGMQDFGMQDFGMQDFSMQDCWRYMRDDVALFSVTILQFQLHI